MPTIREDGPVQAQEGTTRSRRETSTPAPPVFEVAGEVFIPASEAARTLLADLSPSGAYARLKRAAEAGSVRTAQVNRRTRWYHRDDVHELAANLRDT
jgi:hypothetical protein